MKTRLTAALLFLSTPLSAWEAGIDGPLCTLSHMEPTGEVRLTYDPTGPLYTITLTAPEPWPRAPEFGIAFDGALPLTIRTTRHQLSADGRSLSVADQGFGNVLNGLEVNTLATGFSGEAELVLSLDGAAGPVAAFRACTTSPAV